MIRPRKNLCWDHTGWIHSETAVFVRVHITKDINMKWVHANGGQPPKVVPGKAGWKG